jgi:hypothetical protein
MGSQYDETQFSDFNLCHFSLKKLQMPMFGQTFKVTNGIVLMTKLSRR